jgi:uncharacterized protein with FMN-binding domain
MTVLRRHEKRFMKFSPFSCLCICVLVLSPCVLSPRGVVAAEDTVEFLSGAKITGIVKAIRKDQKEFDLQATIGNREVTRTYPFSKVHAVTLKGNRFVLTPLTATAPTKTDANGLPIRSKTEIEAIIDRAGSTMPDWFESTVLDYPDTLDLSWPEKLPTKGWNNKKNMGQYIWDIIHPNPSKWRGGIKLVHHCMTLHEGNQTLLRRDWNVLGRMYFELLQDYPRAAYWLRKGRVVKGERSAVMLAECYWRMGNQKMAMPYLISRSYTAGAAAKAIKLYGNMGELRDALKLTALVAKSPAAYEGYISAGDAMRQAGRFDQAIEFYNKVLSDNNFRNKDYEQRFKARAQESIEAIELFEQVDVSHVSDGMHTASSTGYNGQLNVAVGVSGGKIESVKVTQHKEKQFYSALTDTEASIIKLQTVRGVDGTSGATITSRAIVNATAKALAGTSQ